MRISNCREIILIIYLSIFAFHEVMAANPMQSQIIGVQNQASIQKINQTQQQTQQIKQIKDPPALGQVQQNQHDNLFQESYSKNKEIQQQNAQKQQNQVIKPQINTTNTNGSAGNDTQQIATPSNSGESFLDSVLQKIKDKAKSVTNFITNKKVVSKPQPKPKNPADDYPDPLFFDAIYHEKKDFQTYSIVYNDKSYYENFQIPAVVYQKIDKEIMLLSKGLKKQSQLVLVTEGNTSLGKDYIDNINTQDANGNTPLLFAMKNNHYAGVKALLAGGANPDICNKIGICPIHFAIYNNQIDILQLLLMANVNIMAKDQNGLNAIKLSILHDYRDAFEILIDGDYVFKAQSKNDMMSLLEFAVKNKKMDYGEFLYYKFNLNSNEEMTNNATTTDDKIDSNVKSEDNTKKVKKSKKKHE